MLIIAAPRIFVKGAFFFCPADSGVLVMSAKNLVLSPKVCYTIAIFINSAYQNGIFAICSLRMLLMH